MNTATFLIQLLNSVQYGLLLFLLASGLTLIFGIMGVINLAHGSFYMLGAYLALSLTQLTANLFLVVLLGMPLAVVFGFRLERVLITRLYERHDLHQVLLTYGLILVLDECRSLVWGNDVHSVAVPALFDWSIPLTENLSYPVYRLVVSGSCLLIAAAMYLVIQRTRLGMMIRAGAANREMTQALDVDVRLVHGFVFASGAALAASPLSSS